MRCLLSRAVYGEAESGDLGISNNNAWKVRACRPKLRRDQVVKGMLKLPGIENQTAIQLAARIPGREYPAGIDAIKKYCCKNFCQDCHGARLFGNINMHGFEKVPKGADELLDLSQYCKPKEAPCSWRMAKRRLRDETGVLQPVGWLGRCIACDAKQQLSYDRHNKQTKDKRLRIKTEELKHLLSGTRVQVFM